MAISGLLFIRLNIELRKVLVLNIFELLFEYNSRERVFESQDWCFIVGSSLETTKNLIPKAHLVVCLKRFQVSGGPTVRTCCH